MKAAQATVCTRLCSYPKAAQGSGERKKFVFNQNLALRRGFSSSKVPQPTAEICFVFFFFFLDWTSALPPPCFHHHSQFWAYPDFNEARGTLSYHHKARRLISRKDLFFPRSRPFTTVSDFSHHLLKLKPFPTQTSRAPYAITTNSQVSQHNLISFPLTQHFTSGLPFVLPYFCCRGLFQLTSGVPFTSISPLHFKPASALPT